LVDNVATYNSSLGASTTKGESSCKCMCAVQQCECTQDCQQLTPG
jgi:hypothetical protein